jgi:aarF domain-containing kinase
LTLSTIRLSYRSSHRALAMTGVAVSATAVQFLPIARCDAVAVLQEPVDTNKPATQGMLVKKRSEKIDKVVQRTGTLRELLKRMYRRFKEYLRLLFRSLYLTTMLVPVGLTIPLALSWSGGLNDWWWNYFRGTVRMCGPCMTKFAQWMATRPDIWGLQICDRMKDLQSSKSVVTGASTIENVMLQEFGENWSDSVELIRKYPDAASEELDVIGSGCIAQVVKGKMKETGQTVAIKVVHPGIRESINADIAIMRFVASVAELVPSLQNFSIMDSVEEFASFMLSQASLLHEGHNLDKFRKNFHVDKDEQKHAFSKITFPKPMFPFVSENVLVESYAGGVLVSSLFDEEAELKKEIASIALNALLKMVFDDNFIHGGEFIAIVVILDNADSF